MVRKQFIAGARCPSCQMEDKVRLCRDGAREWIECVACGYASESPGEPAHPPPGGAPADETEVGIVRLSPRR